MTINIMQIDVVKWLRDYDGPRFHAVLSDPPYALGFMGKAFDTFKSLHHFQEWVIEWASLIIEKALHPGAICLFFGGTRTWHRLACGLEDAGFDVFDTVYWAHGQGFPKSYDVAKGIESKLTLGSANWNDWRKLEGIDKDTGNLGYWKLQEEHSYRKKDYTGNGRNFSLKPTTAAAKIWTGYGTALKPAVEPIICCRAPHKETYASLALEYGTGALAIDASRIPITDGATMARNNKVGENGWKNSSGGANSAALHGEPDGRWPANLILDEELVPVLVLRYNTPEDIKTVIKEYYHDYQLPDMQERNQDLPKQNEEGERKVLQPSLLCQVAERDYTRREPSDVRQNPHTGGAGKDKQESEGALWQGTPILQGEMDVSRLLVREHQQSSRQSERNGKEDVAQKTRGNTRTPLDNGDALGQTTPLVRSRASSQRYQDGQPDRKPRNPRQLHPQDVTQGYSKGTARIEVRERTVEEAECALCVLAYDIPEQWLKYFEDTGRTVRLGSAALLNAQSGARRSSGIFNAQDHHGGKYVQGVTNFPGKGTLASMYADVGGASRFFYVAKASNSDRSEGNSHPTCKPTKLTEYLARLILPPVPARLLIPFAGSGSEVIGAIRAGWQEITGIEIDADYCEIARQRIAAETAQPSLLAVT